MVKQVNQLALCCLILLIGIGKASAQDLNGGEKQSGNELRGFVMSCTYGVLAGTLVGAATLAFTENPGDHLRNVAKGASLGLYAGILLGAYVVYVVPGQMEKRRQQEEENLGVRSDQLIVPDIVIANGPNGLEPTFKLSGQFSF